ncbi:CinA family protein [Nocardioides pinisoli]|uniref:Nicotinamide-nucleotide amidohydrolase family protein n=1 Tax=Nocardioides pinisoli TaxID=2950279 RepID=A0ABT1L1P0_9ACTN|nr:nicotinamide-nucleotide amidohydrolase family protein [Nocardioides pinisoli]MCP3423922.1 nicotinamide-nucleotide amidohydrolase family protein [Nocardioides pinisoli]
MWSGEPDGTVAARVLEALAGRGETLATAESLTGGLLSARLTDVPGASRSFVGGVVSYATRVKVAVLGVPDELVAEHGVVSEECALAMARGVRGRLDATWGLATTGVAGPDRQEGREVGTVWVALAGPRGATARLLDLSGDRSAIRQAACVAVLELLARELEG